MSELRCPTCGTTDSTFFRVERIPVPSSPGGAVTAYVDGAVHCRNCEQLGRVAVPDGRSDVGPYIDGA